MYSRTMCIGGIPYKMQRNNNQSKQARKGGASNGGNGLVRAPVAQNRSSRQTGRNSQRYKECERILTIPGSVAFSVTDSIPMNPALSSSFPWLSGHAALFDKYRVHRLVYRYKNLKGTSTDGNVLLSFDYDTLDPPPSTALQMTQATRWIDGAPWRIFELNVPTDGRVLFTRQAAIAGSDLKTYDMGSLHVATEACADTSDHGYLEVEYDIELLDKSPSGTSTAVAKTSSVFNLSAAASSLADQAPIPFDEEIVDALGISNAAGVFTLPIGAFLCRFEASATAPLALEIQKDGAALAIPALSNQSGSTGASAAVVTAYVVSDGTNTVRCINDTGGAITFSQDACRAIFTLA